MIENTNRERTVFISISNDGEERVWYKDEVEIPADDVVLI